MVMVKDIKADTRRYAAEIGLPIFGVASPEPFRCLESLLNKRRQAGMESPFEKKWSAKTRCTPELVFPEVRSVICVGMPYFHPVDRDFSVERQWHISRFAWGGDYHLVLRTKLEQLAAFLRRVADSGFKYFACVDSAPLVERALAFRAGLGWYGKNNLLINPQYGSWFVLGELLVNISLPTDTPMESGCGSCDACIRACPPGALVEPYILDANRCISCITQISQHVSPELRDKAGQGIFGCDICQEVCPKNKDILHAGKENISPFIFSGEGLAALLEISEEEFKKKYGSTGFAWGGKELLQRNAVVALGSTGLEKYIPTLAKALLNSTPQVRSHAAWALGNIGHRQAAVILVQALNLEKNQEVCKEIAQALIGILRRNELD